MRIFHGLGQEALDEGQLEGLGEESGDFAALGLGGEFFRGLARDEDERAPGGLRPELLDPVVERGAVGQIDVGDDDFDVRMGHLFDAFRARGGLESLVAETSHQGREILADGDIVVDDQDVGNGRSPCPGTGPS